MPSKENLSFLRNFFVDSKQKKKSLDSPEDYEVIQIPKEKARKDALVLFWSSTFVYFLLIVFLHFANSNTRLNEVFIVDAISAIIILPLYLCFAFRAYKTSKTFSYVTLSAIGEQKKEEMQAASRIKAEEQSKNERELLFESKWYVRYPLAILLFVFFTWLIITIVDDRKNVLAWIMGIPIYLSIAYMVREIVGILILIGIGYLIYSGIAELPLSVAVIIGAVIIAYAVKNN